MKIKVESERVVKALNKLHGIEVVLENLDDAKEAINLILKKADIFARDDYKSVKDVEIKALQKYETSAVEYKMIFLLDFVFEEETPSETKIAVLKEVQDLFNKS